MGLLKSYFPTMRSSLSVAWSRNRFQRSIVKRVAELLKMEVRELIRAAIITAIIKPRMPAKQSSVWIFLRWGLEHSLQRQPPPPINVKLFTCGRQIQDKLRVGYVGTTSRVFTYFHAYFRINACHSILKYLFWMLKFQNVYMKQCIWQ